ncbi:hypothetical protein COU19_02885 [Candidatus Kaiserbacteria bacterium CG10_big_fil_rev_8_21_14_0_10_56_12]|uniref:DUF4142 domain-containing protein n=1 Tax=Candidatus Kaiserbacteria bacterium CG10_big_fil_rev_8_21_14_0_10_56_12 TaxID=1974611 RepID=A0A2H0UB30_9BACT|nr:MAG: hypothetical protein COU19_02885 [Candidatus Kaiserbacteria bacterium CG10_big_fil_rev_8_21_14_0_10_56_12]
MIKKHYAIPVALLALVTVGGATAYAATTPNMAPFASFSAAQQTAIEQAFTIRQDARTKAQDVLDAAGVTPGAMRTAMNTYRSNQRTAIDAALTANDYAAFQALVANSPMASELTQDVFAKLVEIHKLEVSGDHAGAAALRKELTDAGIHGLGIGHMGGRGMMMGGHGFGPDNDNDGA